MSNLTADKITDPNEVVQGLARVFYFGLRKAESGRLVEHLSSGKKALCGPDLHWWWRNGMACPATLATTESVPEGSVNSWTRPYFAQLEPEGLQTFTRARLLHERLVTAANSLRIDYIDLLGVATSREVRRAAFLAKDLTSS